MNKLSLFIVFAISISTVFGQKRSASLRLKAYQRSYISGVAPTPIVEIGGKETATTTLASEPEYFIYLLANKVPYLKIERVWIRNQLYIASIDKINKKPVVIAGFKKKDTLIKYTDEMVWQIKLIRKDTTGIKPKKDIANQVRANELVIRLNDKAGTVFTRTVKQIPVLEAVRGQ
jgi:hypothetical protein